MLYNNVFAKGVISFGKNVSSLFCRSSLVFHGWRDSLCDAAAEKAANEDAKQEAKDDHDEVVTGRGSRHLANEILDGFGWGDLQVAKLQFIFFDIPISEFEIKNIYSPNHKL